MFIINSNLLKQQEKTKKKQYNFNLRFIMFQF